MKRDLVSLADLSREEIQNLLDHAARLKARLAVLRPIVY